MIFVLDTGFRVCTILLALLLMWYLIQSIRLTNMRMRDRKDEYDLAKRKRDAERAALDRMEELRRNAIVEAENEAARARGYTS